MLPSKELLSAVLKENTVFVEEVPLINKSLLKIYRIGWVNTPESPCETINIYELMHLMKEWAVSTYEIEFESNFSKAMVTIETIGWCENKGEWGCLLDQASGSTEFEAVTKACEWILNERV